MEALHWGNLQCMVSIREIHLPIVLLDILEYLLSLGSSPFCPPSHLKISFYLLLTLAHYWENTPLGSYLLTPIYLTVVTAPVERTEPDLRYQAGRAPACRDAVSCHPWPIKPQTSFPPGSSEPQKLRRSVLGTVSPTTCAQGCVLVTETQAAQTGCSAQHTKGLEGGWRGKRRGLFPKTFQTTNSQKRG